MVEIKDVSKIYTSRRRIKKALNEVTILLPDFGLVGLAGESGSGKTTLLKKIENSYKILGIEAKKKYINENNIVDKAKMSESELLFEWTWHNILYYLDIFGALRGHTKDVDFGW